MTATTDQLRTVDRDLVVTSGAETLGDTTLDDVTTVTAPVEPPGAAADPFCESVARFAASALGAPVAYVSIVDGGVERLPGAVDRESVRPTRVDEIGGVVSRAQQELRMEDGTVVGSLCVADRRERTWVEKDFAQLAQLAELLVPQLEPQFAADRRAAEDMRADDMAPSGTLSDDLAVMAASVHSLADLAELTDNPSLQRCAATSRRRLATALESAKTLAPARVPDVREFDLRHAVGRALREATFVSGRREVDAALGQYALPTDGDQFAAERAVTHLVSVVLDHTGSGCVRVDLDTGSYTDGGERDAVLSVQSDDCRISAAEIARVAASFDAETGSNAVSVRLERGAVVASSARVSSISGPSGTHFVVRWALARG